MIPTIEAGTRAPRAARSRCGDVRVLLVSSGAAAGPLTAARFRRGSRGATLIDTVKAGKLDELVAIFGPEGRELVATSDPATGRQNQEVFIAAVRENWHLVDAGANRKTLVIGNEEWPFPVPLLKEANAWRFDTAAGKEEVLARRIGRNELAVIETCRAYVSAQRRYAEQGHDGKPSAVHETFQAIRQENGYASDGARAEAQPARRPRGASRRGGRPLSEAIAPDR